ncbi:MAG: aminoacyl-tRNA hydrolase [Sphingomonas sp.]|uniref:alternative ribosome rescue aminoacyl-tRNA hydrolase ArfB n=1 Tax=Sphingomonas sp. TaxID=28214 RepID=UPI000DB606F6|nr:aminoacyl-tRNA hydrolase [Zymomonas sp.]MBA4771676.1 aminoacyl-tRNA hydrolase [Sphingomonas sp.]PZP18592.1 MAG: aminoacyl-tRNA hydrolase [Sphingomonas hengshuiensis]
MAEFTLPEGAVEEKFLAATGPGGQNVNKVATACQLRVDVFALGLAPDVYTRLKTLAGSKFTATGTLLITARKHRTQEANRADARERATALIVAAHQRPVFRVKTKPSKTAKAKRVDAKKERGLVKAGRGRVVVE